MSVALLTQAAECLGPLADEVVFLGGASIGLWLSERLRERGFNEDSASGVICRWRHGSGVVLDVMPTDTTVLGFANRWYPDAFDTATRLTLPRGQSVRAASPALMVATKIEAFHGRGDGDYLASSDFEDIIRLIDGRPELVDEILIAPREVREFIADSLRTMMTDAFFETGVAGALPPDAASQSRLPIVLDRVTRLAV